MRFNDFNYKHGKDFLKLLHSDILLEIESILNELEPFPHGAKKQKTCVSYLTKEFVARGWQKEASANFSTDKEDLIDLCKWKVAIELEFSRFEQFFRDFFRFILLYENKEIDVGIIITLDEMAFKRWKNDVKIYKSARANLQKLIDLLRGDYSKVINVPLWCIGIE